MRVEERRIVPSMQDVADLAGVSHQTVSRVINNEAAIRPETRARVEDAISRLGYRRNLTARALAAGRTLAIGVIIPPGSDYGPTSVFHAIDRAVRIAGYRPVITSSERNKQSLADSIDFVLGQRVEGVVVVAPHIWAAEVIEHARVPIPLVSVQTTPSSQVPSVSIDQAAGIRLVVDHLAALGHVRLQHLAGSPEFQESVDRAAAVAVSVTSRGLLAGPQVQGDWSAASGFHAASRVAPETTAVVCANDQMGLGMISGLRAHGRRVPEDVAVTGFDDTPESRYFWPPLTTVRQDFDALGELATRAIVASIRGESAGLPIRLTPALVVRGST